MPLVNHWFGLQEYNSDPYRVTTFKEVSRTGLELPALPGAMGDGEFFQSCPGLNDRGCDCCDSKSLGQRGAGPQGQAEALATSCPLNGVLRLERDGR
jgi:hypothetical protein